MTDTAHKKTSFIAKGACAALAAALVVGTVPASALAATDAIADAPATTETTNTVHGSVVKSGYLNAGVTWTYWSDGTLEYSGKGTTNAEFIPTADGSPSYGNVYGPSKTILKNAKALVYDEGITKIYSPSNSEKVNYTFTSIQIPASVTDILTVSFVGAKELKTVSFARGSKLTTIGNQAFQNCSSLTSIVLPSSLTEIGLGAFTGCTSMKWAVVPIKAKLPKLALSTGNLAEDVFGSGSAAPSKVKVYRSFTKKTTAGTLVYKKTGSKTVTLLDYVTSKAKPLTVTTVKRGKTTYKVTAIESKALMGAKVTSVKLGKNVTKVAANAFNGCTGLKKVANGRALKTIGASAFKGCTSLSSFKLTSTVLKKIGASAFAKDAKLKTVSIAKTTKLTKAGCKNSLKNSSVAKVNVKNAKASKYAKYFTKANAGLKAAVK